MSKIRTYRVNHAMQMISIPLHSTTNSYHLGNNREVVDASGNVIQVTNYYPFGAPYADATASKGSDVQPYKYNGKELDLMHGLNTYDYGARQHDPILARWDRMDRFCEKYYNVSPYAYCGNNPIKYIDIHGDSLTLIGDEKALERVATVMGRNTHGSSYKIQNGKVVQDKVSDDPNKYDDFFNNIINCQENITINVVEGSSDIIIGNASSSTIDISDIENIGFGGPIVNSATALAHEIYEQKLIQTKGTDTRIAHLAATGIETDMINKKTAISPLREISGSMMIVQGKSAISGFVFKQHIKLKNGNVVK